MRQALEYSQSRERWKALVVALLVTLAAAALFGRAYHGQAIMLDDWAYYVENARVRQGLSWENLRWALSTDHMNLWQPATWASLMLDTNLLGDNAHGHHLVNILLHSANAGLLALAAMRLTGGIFRGGLAALFWAIHPLRVESVAWITERKDVLSGFFALLTILLYLRFTRRRSIVTYLAMLVCFCLGLMSKSILVSLPVILMMLDVWPLKRWDPFSKPAAWRGVILEKLPLLAAGLLTAKLTLWAGQTGLTSMKSLEEFSILTRITNVIVCYPIYLWRQIWPVDLALFYQHPIHWPTWRILIGSAAMIGVTGGVTLLYLRGRPWWLAAWGWMAIGLIPVSGLFQSGDQSMADRFTYYPAMGLFIAAAMELPRNWRWPAAGAVAAAAAALAILCHIQLGYWRDSRRLFEHSLSIDNTAWMIHHNHGALLLREKQHEQALAHFNAALELWPQYADAHWSKARTLVEMRRYADAITHYQYAISCNPKLILAYIGLSHLLSEQGEVERAIGILQNGAKVNPDNAMIFNNLGAALAKAGRIQEAAGALERSLQLDPTNQIARFNLDRARNALRQEGRK